MSEIITPDDVIQGYLCFALKLGFEFENLDLKAPQSGGCIMGNVGTSIWQSFIKITGVVLQNIHVLLFWGRTV